MSTLGDATALAQDVREKRASPLELVDEAIARIEAQNPALNAVITPMFDQAREAAQDPKLPEGPLRGVPFLLKDLVATYAGVPMASGSKALKDHIPKEDSELVKRFKAAGLIVLGKTNTCEFGLLPTTEPLAFGPTRNPWDLSRTAGGSSGGSAAAVAAGMVPAAHGNDGGGSIRIPASCTGIFGLKPTRARNPLGPGVFEILSGLVEEHVLTKSVRDSALFLDVTEGPGPGAPYCAPPLQERFTQSLKAASPSLRVAYSTQRPDGTEVHPDCVRAVETSVRLLERLGHTPRRVTPPVPETELLRAFMILWASGTARDVQALQEAKPELTEEDFEPFTWGLKAQGEGIRATAYLWAVECMRRAGARLADFFTDYDLWLTPTLGEPPLPLGSLQGTRGNPLAPLATATRFVPFTPLANLIGNPAMSVPLFWNDEGLPIGVHFLGRFGEESFLLQLAKQLENECPWSHRTPPAPKSHKDP